MKDVFLIIKITIIGLLVAVFVYPIVHESGHIISTILTGGRFIKLSWIPTPNILCEVNSTNTTALAIINLSGMILPIVFIMPFYKTKGFIRFGALIFCMIIILSAVIGLIVSIISCFGINVSNDDVTSFIEFSGWLLPTILIMIAMIGISAFQLMRFKPVETIDCILSISVYKNKSITTSHI